MRTALTAALAALLALPATAQVGSERPGRPAESLADWRSRCPLAVPDGEGRWVDCVLPPAVFGAARLDLADLRIFDARGGEIPYALRVRRPQRRSVLRPARPFDRARAADGAGELSLDLGETVEEHNAIEVRTSGREYRRTVQLDGSDDGRAWKRLAEGQLLDFGDGDRRLTRRVLGYGATRFRYLRVRVHPDPQGDAQPVEIAAVDVRQRVAVSGEWVVRELTPGPLEYRRHGGQPATSWTLDLGADQVPAEALEVDVEDAELGRDVIVDRLDEDQRTTRLANVRWRRRAGERRPLVVELPAQTRASRLRLTVVDRRNRPLRLRAVRVRAAARQLVMLRAAGPGPWTLYAGNPEAAPPGYDLDRTLPRVVEPAPDRATVGALVANPAYRPAPPTLAERAPWLIHVVLGLVSVLLAALAASVARTAVAAHDQRLESAA